MRTLLIIICSLLIIPVATAQEFVTDESIETTVMAEDDQLKILYFTASWCGPCRYMKPVMKSIQEDPAIKVTIYKMDIDKNSADNMMGVRSVPTYYFIRNGKLLGSAVGARDRETMVSMINKYTKSEKEGSELKYKLKPSSYDLIAGSHPKLTVKNLTKIWHNGDQLNTLAWNIYTNLTAEQDIECALILAQRSIELENTSGRLSTYAHLLFKNGDSKKAKKAALAARKKAKKSRESTTAIDKLLEDIQA